MEDSLWYSLRTPHIERSGSNESVLVAHHFFGYKVGYFVAAILDDMVAIVTYLFLTMDGTPEGRRLHERLRLRRPDKEHLELDKLNTFLLSDIRKDAELAEIFRECGCGHLLNMVKDAEVPDALSGKADEVRQYAKTWLQQGRAKGIRANTQSDAGRWLTDESAP